MNEWNSSSAAPIPSGERPQRSFIIRVITRLWRWFRNLFAVIGFVYTLVPICLIWILFHNLQSSKPKPTAKASKSNGPQSVWLQLDSSILESEPRMGSEILRQFFGNDGGIYLPELRATLRSASTDANVKDLNILVDGLQGSMADLEELRGMISEFKASGKPITSYILHMDNAALIITSATDKVILAPVAEVMIPGPAFPSIYMGDALRKVGVDIQVVRAGKYKNAFESFIANEPSAESREEMNSLESSLRNRMVKLVAEGRKKQDSEAFLWLKESIFTAAKAKELGIVDDLAYPPNIDFDDGKNITADDYAMDTSGPLSQGYSLTPQKGIALIEAVGEIVGVGDDSRMITPAAIQDELEWARTNTDIAAVVLRVSSPGGSASASDLIWESVRRLNAEKPVIASFGSVAASGGYYISAGARKIIADPSTITGSIGVIGMIPNFEPFKEKYGLSFPITTQSNRAAMLSGGKKMTADDLRYLENTIDDTYRTFKSRVAEGRKMTLDKVEALAQGRVYTGMQAKELGLVDELGSLKDAMQIAKKEAGLDEKKLYPVHRYEPTQLSLSECLTSISKMKRCIRRHGSHIRSSMEDEILGDEGRAIKATLKATSVAARRDRIATLYTGGVPN